MVEIYVVSRAYNYEGSNPVLAFTDRALADAFQKHCNEYQAEKPTFPSNYEDDVVYGAYEQAEKKWRTEHPAGESAAGADYFCVDAIELK
jgi:hypothetical protein